METIRIELHNTLFQDIKTNFCYDFSCLYFKEENIQIDCFLFETFGENVDI